MSTGSVMVVQEYLPSYRLPFFEELGSRVDRLVVATADTSARQEPTNFAIEHFRLEPRLTGTPLRVLDSPDVGRLVREVGPAAVVMSANPRFRFNRSIAREARALGARRYGWGLGTMNLTPLVPASIRALGRRRMRRHFDEVFAYSSRGAAEYVKLGYEPTKVHVAYNSKWSRDSLPARPERRRNGPMNVVFVGQLTRRKRVDALLAAWSQVPEGLRGELWVVGDGPERSSLIELDARLAVGGHFPGIVQGAELTDLLGKMDLAVLPGTGGLALHDAFANSLPVICGRGDGTQFDLVTPACGWLLEGDPDAELADLLSALARAPDQLPAMGAAARRRLEDVFNVETMADVFQRVLAGGHG